MALYNVSAGGTILAADLDQFYNLLVGVMTDQEVILADGLIVQSATVPLQIYQGSGTPRFQIRSDNSATDPGVPWIRTDGSSLTINPHGTGKLFLAQDVATQIEVGGNLNAQGLLFGHNGFACVESGNGSLHHIESYPAQGSNTGTADGTGPSVTFTFARAFTATPAVSGSCEIAAMFGRGGYAVPTAISTTAVTMTFINNDGGSRTVQNWSMQASGA